MSITRKIFLFTIVLLSGLFVYYIHGQITIPANIESDSETATQFPPSYDRQDFVPIEQLPIGATRTFPQTPPGLELKDISTRGLLTAETIGETSAAFSSLTSELFLDKYWVEECTSPGGVVDRAIILTAKPNPQGELSDARVAVQNFEPFVLNDLGTVLFPLISESALQNKLIEFKKFDSYTRFAEFTLEDQKATLYYSWVLNFPIFATSPQCLTATINDTYAPHSH